MLVTDRRLRNIVYIEQVAANVIGLGRTFLAKKFAPLQTALDLAQAPRRSNVAEQLNEMAKRTHMDGELAL